MNPDQLLQQGRAVLAQTKAEGLKSYATSKYAKKTPVDFNRLKTIPAELVASNPQPYNLNLPTPNVPSSGLQPIIDSSVATYKTQSEQDRLAREQAQTNAKSDLSKSINDIMGLNEEIGNVSSTVDRTEENKSRAEVDRLVSEIEAEQKSLQDKLARLDKNPQGLFGGALEDEKNRIRRESESRQADLSISLNAQNRNYTRAKEIADSEVQNKLEPLKIKLENLKFFYQENKELFNKEDERLYNEKIKAEERALDKEENLQNQIMNLKLEGIKSGSLNRSDLAKLNNAKSYEDAFNIVLQSWKNPSSGVLEAPTVKTINGVDMQWNGSTGQWETIGAGGVDADKNTLDKLKFLRDTTASATSLANTRYSRSGISRGVAGIFKGAPNSRQLETLANTLKTNMLTLMADPAIKKFFGPQMSERDTELMMSAGSTLDVRSNSREQMRKELKRIDELFNRMQTAVTNGGVGGNVITAPDGTIIEIVD